MPIYPISSSALLYIPLRTRINFIQGISQSLQSDTGQANLRGISRGIVIPVDLQILTSDHVVEMPLQRLTFLPSLKERARIELNAV